MARSRGSVTVLLALLMCLTTGLAAACAPHSEITPPIADLSDYDDSGTPVIPETGTTIGFADSDLIGLPAERIGPTVALMKSTGVRSVRILVPWVAIEPTRGAFDWTLVDRMVNSLTAQGMTILATLNSTPGWVVAPGLPALSGRPADPADYGAFAGAVAERYRGRISAYEVWNEPNAAMFYTPAPDPAGFVALLKAAYPAIKAQDPAAVVVSGGLGAIVDYQTVTMDAVKFVAGMYAAGAKGHFDALAFHPYQYTTKFSAGGYHPDGPINQVAGIREQMVANGDGAKKIWATEYGEPSSVVGERTQAEYVDDMLTAWREMPYAGPVYVYTMRDRNSRSQVVDDTLGAFRSDGTPKPLAEVISAHAVGSGQGARVVKTTGG